MTLLQQALEALEYHTAQTRPIERTNEAITALREAIAQGAVVQQWVSVKDKMPEPQVRVLGAKPQRNIVEVDMWFGPDFQWGYSHWMPIPAAPKEQA